ncbi:hypothetical protein IJ21_47890 [Paenibacillus sp. 32O-W]|jgi:hypothetical protein|nr:hypothetical protein IJ21_47890 [Paenibacillus sp. 32O-W]
MPPEAVQAQRPEETGEDTVKACGQAMSDRLCHALPIMRCWTGCAGHAMPIK